VTTDFFQDIYVPRTMLFDECVYDDTEQVWIWRVESSDIYFDQGTVVKLRVEKENWNSLTGVAAAEAAGNADTRAMANAPYSIEGSMAEPGLGGVDWW
jgi:DNA-directed RNA polymerase III subunit RPC8